MTSLNSTATSEPMFETSDATENTDFTSPTLRATLAADADFSYLGQQGSPLRNTQPLSVPMSPSDAAWLQHENKIMRQKLKQIQIDYKSEQDTVAQLRKRLNNTEKEKLDIQSKTNEEVAQAQGEAARLRAQLEKGEAIRQSIEYELAKVRKEISYHKQSAADKEALLSEINEGLKEKIGDLSEQLELSKKHITENKVASDGEIKKLSMQQEEKENLIVTLKTEQDILESGRARQEMQITQLQSTVKEQEEKLAECEETKKRQTELLRKQTNELEFSKDREERLKEDLQTTLSRVKALEDAIEAERAAHLESKFNSEIIQLRIRDLEAALEMEKSAKMDTIVTSEKLNQQLNEIQQLYDDEKRMGKEAREKIERSERKQQTVTQQLSAELDEKKAVISKMSSQLEVHQKNFDELKQELAQAKKRQAFLEETYGGGIKEMELVLENFQPDVRTKKKRLADTKEKAKHPTPSDVLRTLRNTLTEYKDKVDRTNAELAKSRSRCAALTKETDSYKEMIISKDKTIEDTQKSVSRTNKELRKLQNEISEHQTTITKLKIDYDVTAKALEKEREESRELHSQTIKLKSKLGNDEHAVVEYLHGLYQRMVTGHIVHASPGGGFGHFTRSDLMALIDDQVATLLSAVDKSIQKTRYLESVIQGKDTAIQEMQKVYEEQMERVASVAKEHSSAWQQQKEELEQHYGKMLAEIHARHKKTQTLADQAWEKMRATGSVQQGLQAECNKLQAQLAKQQQDHKAGLAACALLAGALYSSYLRISALCTQRHLLQQQVNKLEFFKEHVSKAVHDGTVRSGQLSDSRSEKKQLCKNVKKVPLLRFRTGAIAVLAANRLRKLGKKSQCAFVVQDLYIRGDSATVLTGAGDTNKGHREFSDNLMYKWLSSQKLQQVIQTSMTELQQHLSHKDQHVGVSEAARKSFRWLMDQLNTFFQLQPQEVSAGLREQKSLVKLLGHGLRRCHSLLSQEALTDASTEKCLANLQNMLLQQSQHLAQLEGSRRQLQQEVSGLKKEQLEHSRDEDTVALLQQELEALKARAVGMVSREKFESVCQELTAALQREEQAQELMKEQGQQLEMLSQQLDQQANMGSQKERSLSDAAKELSECKMELKRKEQLMRQLNRQMGQSEGEKKGLLNNIHDAENALRTAARDKDALNQYMKAVAKALEQFQLDASRMTAFALPDATVLLSPDLHPQQKKPGPELARCKLLINSVVDILKQVATKMQGLGGDIKAYQEHIKVLKAELNAACRREYDAEREFAEPDQPPINTADHWYRSTEESPEKDHFSPLIEDKSSISFAPEVTPSQIPVSPYKNKKLTRSPVTTSTPNYKTPPQASLRGSTLKQTQTRVIAK